MRDIMQVTSYNIEYVTDMQESNSPRIHLGSFICVLTPEGRQKLLLLDVKTKFDQEEFDMLGFMAKKMLINPEQYISQEINTAMNTNEPLKYILEHLKYSIQCNINKEFYLN